MYSACIQRESYRYSDDNDGAQLQLSSNQLHAMLLLQLVNVGKLQIMCVPFYHHVHSNGI
jgi:hypothetical protein